MRILSFVLFLISLQAWSQEQNPMVTTVNLGDTPFKFIQHYGKVDDQILFINVHEDEITSIETVEEYAKNQPVHFVRIGHVQTRRLEFELKGKTYNVDPNRIYTRKGRRKTLKDGGKFSFSAAKEVKAFASSLLNYLENRSVIIAMHNNTDVNYTIKSYLPGGDEAQNTAQIHINPEMDADDFVYTTDLGFFEKLKARNINVILQDNKKYVNDGSLSVYCGKKGIPYINIEAQKGHFDEQLFLIKEVMAMLQMVNS